MNTQNNGLFNFNHIPSNLPNIPSNISNIVSGLISNANKSNNEGDSALSIENKRQRAKALVSTFENYKKNSPFHTGFLRSLAQKFQNFISWLFRMNPSFPLSSIEMQFAMQLYRTCDAQLLTKTENEKKIPFSYILESWAHFLKELDQGKSSNEHVALKKCAEYQKSIETARLNSHPVWRKASIYFLQTRISRAIDQLQIDQSILIPGGYLSKGVKDVQAKRTEMLYEVRRTNAGYTFRIFHNSDAIGIEKVEKSYSLRKDQIFAHLNEILELQAICDTSENERGLSKVINEYGGYALTLFKLRKAPKDLNTLTSVAKNAIDKSIYTSSESRFKNLLLKFRDYTRAINQNANAAELSPNKSDEKVTEIFFTCKDAEQATIQKLGMKLSVLFDLFDKTRSFKQKDEKFSIWLRDNAIHLTKTIDRKIGDCDDLKGIKGKLNEIVEEFSHSVQEKVLLPPAPDKQKSNPNIFSDPLIFLQEDIPVSSFSKLKAKSIGTLSPLPVEEQTFENLLNSCKSLSQGKKLDLLRLRLTDAYNHLFHLDQDAEHWKGLSILDREEWSEKIVQLVKYSAQINFANDEKAVPQHFLQIVKSFEICQRLAWLNDEKTKFKDFHFDMSAIRDILKDPYLDLGHTGPDLLSALDQIEGNRSNLVRLTTSTPSGLPEKKFYAGHEPNLSLEQTKELYTDLGDKNLLPKNIVHLRQMNILLRMVTARYRTLDYPGFWNKAKAFAGGCVKYLSEMIEKKELLGLIPGYMRKIDEHLEKIEAPKSFGFLNPISCGLKSQQ